MTAADAIHGHHRQERTTATAVGRPGDGIILIGRVRREAAPVPAVSMAVIDSTGVASFIDLLT